MTRGGALALVLFGMSVAGAMMVPLLHSTGWNIPTIVHSLFALIGGGTAAVGLGRLMPHPLQTPQNG